MMTESDPMCNSAAVAASLTIPADDICSLAELSPEQIVHACCLTEVKAMALRLEEELRPLGQGRRFLRT